ncbi:copper amine oxidase [Gymnopilus junonius]|uniref:Amine oxidase n=1 Tax=Gymnopilus junonius TaxID=109634 RepID=A0A9P5TKH0_GYMJU|nr:copper amine oxidase [Gymnopilus junonius]
MSVYQYKLIDPDPPGEPAPKNRKFVLLGLRKRSWILCLSLIFNVLSFVVILRHSHDLKSLFSQKIFFGDNWDDGLDATTPAENTNINQDAPGRCVSSHSRQASPPAPLNPWASLSISETSEIEAWLEAPERQLNLTKVKDSDSSDNVVFMIETYNPPKLAALAYLENPSQVSQPERYARVTLHHGAREEPVAKDYLVGPLPVGKRTTIRPLEEIYHRKAVPFNSRGVELSQMMRMIDFIGRELQPINHAIEDLFGASMRGQPNDTLSAGMVGPYSFDGSFRRLWVTWRRNGAGTWLMPVNFYQYIDVSGTNPSQWKLLKLVYHDQIFPSVSSFLEAFNNGTLIKHPGQADPNIDLTWAQRKRVGTDRDLDHIPGPRYRVDKEQKYVSWMGWGMYLGFDRDMGLSLWDVRFRGERIIYQLAPQEAIAQYGGSDPAQATTAWLDRYFGMGGRVRNMIPYYDCPQESTYLPATTYSMLGSVYVERAICIFEQDTGKPLSRHTGDTEGEFGAVKSYVLTVRSISTFDYMFYLDGTIEVRLSASGYMQGGYWQPNKDPYGGRIHDVSMGNLHDHVINYKVDFDIAGTSNSLLKTTTQVETVTYPWLDDDWGQDHIQQKIIREYITNEDDALLKHPPNFQGEAKNAWGYPRGYAIHPGQSSIHNTVVGSKRLLNNANWARYNLAVSHRKEAEPSSSSMWNLHLPGAPMVDFHKFFDGENITQKDLVAWINVGMHHLNAILLHVPTNPGEPYSYDNYGVQQDFTCLPDSPSPFEYLATQWLEEEGTLRAMTPDKARDPADMYLRFRVGE